MLLRAIGLLAGLLLALPGHAALVTYLEPRLVDEMETVRLTIRAEGTAQSEAPDLTPLMEDFEILGNQTSSRISSINGRTMASVEYQISLRPKRTGELTVPSLAIGGERSEAIRLVVRPLDPMLKQSIERMVFFETSLSTNPVYVQAETVLTRRLYYSQGVQIYSDLPGVPEVAHAVVIPLGETQSRTVLRDGQRYGVIEQRFALFPEQSGPLIIPAISVTSSVRLQSGGRTRRSGIRVSTEPIELEVLPIPAAYPSDATWLPAKSVTATQQWTPDRARVGVGEPLEFEIEVTADGNRGSAIPPIPLPLPADRFKIYPEAPVMDETAGASSITGTRQQRFALIPTDPGPVTVPSLQITWWDTAADRLRQTSVPIGALTVTGAATAPTAEPDVSGAAPDPEPAAAAARRRPATTLPWLLAGLTGLTLLLVAAGVRQLLRRHGERLRPPAWLNLPAAAPLRHHRKALETASGAGNLGAFRQALAAYLAAGLEMPAPDALAVFRADPEAAATLRQLDQVIYAESSTTPAAMDTAELTLRAKQLVANHRAAPREDVLPALYG